MDNAGAPKAAPWYGAGAGGPMPSTAALSDSARAAGLRFGVRRSLASLSLGEGRLFVDCPEHGPGRPLAAERPGLRMANGSYVAGGSMYDLPVAVAGDAYGAPVKMLLCPACWSWAPFRQIAMRGRGASGRPCGGACTSGKRSCDCRCEGLCHGAGRCRCGGGGEQS